MLITTFMSIPPEKVAESLRNQDKEYDTLSVVKGYVRKQVNAHTNPVTEAKPVPIDIGAVDAEAEEHSNGHTCEHNHDKTHDDDMLNYIASLMRSKGKGRGGKGRAPMDVDEGIRCYYCGEMGHRKAQCPVLDRVMKEWRGKRGGKDKGKGKGGWKGEWGRNPWAGGSKGGWNHEYSQGDYGKGKGEWGSGASKGKGLYGLDGPSLCEDPWWGEETAFGLFMAEEADRGAAWKPCPAPAGPPRHHTRSRPRGDLLLKNAYDVLAEDDDEEPDVEYPKLEEAVKVTKKKPKCPRFRQKTSKQTARKQDRKIDDQIESMLHYLDMDDEPDDHDDPMYAVAGPWSRDGGEWLKVASVVDSGAAEHVTSRDMAPGVRITPSAGSRRGQTYVAANGDAMANEGEQALTVLTEEGAMADMTFQITDVRRPLCSVGKICDRGNRVIFGRGGGVIHNLSSGRLTPFKRRGNIYALDLWVRQGEDDEKGGSASGFTRRG